MTSAADFIQTTLNNAYGSGTTAFENAGKTDTAKTKNLTNTSLQRYLSSVSPEKADAKTIFKKLSIDLNGDGKTISKNNLDDYISKAKNEEINISEEELEALTDLQNNWNKISGGSSVITYADISQNKDILLSMVPQNDTEAEDWASIAKDSTAKAYAYIMESALKFSADYGKDEKSGLSSLLNTLLSGTTDEKDDENTELIAKLTNMLAEFKKNSTVTFEA